MKKKNVIITVCVCAALAVGGISFGVANAGRSMAALEQNVAPTALPAAMTSETPKPTATVKPASVSMPSTRPATTPDPAKTIKPGTSSGGTTQGGSQVPAGNDGSVGNRGGGGVVNDNPSTPVTTPAPVNPAPIAPEPAPAAPVATPTPTPTPAPTPTPVPEVAEPGAKCHVCDQMVPDSELYDHMKHHAINDGGGGYDTE